MGETFSVHLDKVTDAVQDAIPAASFKAMEHVRGVAVDLAPRDSGALRASASTIQHPNGADVYFPGPYSRYQEYGMSESGHELKHDVGQSFYLVTAITRETPRVLEILAEELRKVIE